MRLEDHPDGSVTVVSVQWRVVLREGAKPYAKDSDQYSFAKFCDASARDPSAVALQGGKAIPASVPSLGGRGSPRVPAATAKGWGITGAFLTRRMVWKVPP